MQKKKLKGKDLHSLNKFLNDPQKRPPVRQQLGKSLVVDMETKQVLPVEDQPRNEPKIKIPESAAAGNIKELGTVLRDAGAHNIPNHTLEKARQYAINYQKRNRKATPQQVAQMVARKFNIQIT